MTYKLFFLTIFLFAFAIITPSVSAQTCVPTCDPANDPCDLSKSFQCEPTTADPNIGSCEKALGINATCVSNCDKCDRSLGLYCEPSAINPNFGSCQPSVAPAAPVAPAVTSGIGKIFGSISPPPSLSKFIAGDPSGAKGIGNFLSNLIILIYIFAAIALLFMLLWGAFDWITSEGEKEKINAARGKIINAIIGLMLFAVAFAFLRVLGTFTGFTFFSG